ncbi:MAG: YbaY family lipoprotein [Bacteroidetes bacterium]|nr:YbaY family lipoprotein [Bacteroidota bacterium]
MKRTFTYSIYTLIICSLTFLLLAGCSTPTPSSRPTGNIITGTLTAGNIVLFPPYTVVEIILSDEQAVDDEPREVAKQIIKNPQVNPIKFSLRYDREDIVEYRSYAIYVKVYNQENSLLYKSLKGSPVLTHNNPDKVIIDLISQ